MEHGLGGIELGNWWEDTASITCEKNDIAWVVCRETGNFSVRNILDRISTIIVSFVGRALQRFV